MKRRENVNSNCRISNLPVSLSKEASVAVHEPVNPSELLETVCKFIVRLHSFLQLNQSAIASGATDYIHGLYISTQHRMDGTMDAPPPMIHLPQWAIDLHNFRQSLFLNTVEPIIVKLLGPVEEGIDGTQTLSYTNMDGYSLHKTFENVDMGIELGQEDPRRRLGYLPDYVEDASVFRETSMSFASLVMLFTIMGCLLMVFLSCFYHNQKTSPLFASPRRHRLPKLVPPPLPVDGTFSWIKVCFYMSDEEVSYSEAMPMTGSPLSRFFFMAQH